MSELLVAIDGGGALGTGSALCMAQLERDLGSVKERALAGTSTGGLLVLMRAIGMSWQEIEVKFNSCLGRVFHQPDLSWRMNPWKPKWQSDGLEKVAKEVFGDRKCGDVVTPFFVTASDFTNGKPKVYDSTDTEYLYNVALATSAALTYFVPRQVGFCGCDGGFWANAPIMVGITGAIGKLGLKLDQIKCLSLDTGGAFWKNPKISQNETKLQLVEPIIEFMLHGTEEAPAYQAKVLLGDRYLRIGPTNPHDFEMDDLKTLDEFRGLWRASVLARKQELLDFIVSA